MKCPTIEEIEKNKNNQFQLARWYRFCDIMNGEDSDRMNLIMEYFKGFTPELSKQVGWDHA